LAVGTGFATTALYTASNHAKAASSGETSIVIGYESKDLDKPHESLQAVKKNVPEDWYEDLQRARDVKIIVKNNYSAKDGVVGIGTSPGIYGGENSYVFVDVLPEHIDELRGEIPEQIDDVPVRVQEGSPPVLSGHSPCDSGNSNCNNYNTKPDIPGGFVCEGDSDQPQGTFLTPMYDASSNRHFATAAHLFDTPYSGKPIWHPDDGSSSNEVAEIVDGDCYLDFVVGDERNGNYPQRRIDGASPESVNGQFDRDGVADLKAQNEYVRKIGVTTCETCGYVESTDYFLYGVPCSPRPGQVKWGEGSDIQDGDSGAPVYHENPYNSSYQWIVSTGTWYIPGDSSGGTGAWKIKNQTGYHF
jgi:hypothetical protein